MSHSIFQNTERQPVTNCHQLTERPPVHDDARAGVMDSHDCGNRLEWGPNGLDGMNPGPEADVHDR